MRCEFLFFYMVSLNSENHTNQWLPSPDMLTSSNHFILQFPISPMTILHNHIQSEESVVIDNGKQTNFDR